MQAAFSLNENIGAKWVRTCGYDRSRVRDGSRITQRIADSLRIFEQRKFASIRVVYLSQGIDTDSEQAELLLATHRIVDSLYIRELAKKTRRGVEGIPEAPGSVL